MVFLGAGLLPSAMAVPKLDGEKLAQEFRAPRFWLGIQPILDARLLTGAPIRFESVTDGVDLRRDCWCYLDAGVGAWVGHRLPVSEDVDV
jgi:hypothetical protein